MSEPQIFSVDEKCIEQYIAYIYMLGDVTRKSQTCFCPSGITYKQILLYIHLLVWNVFKSRSTTCKDNLTKFTSTVRWGEHTQALWFCFQYLIDSCCTYSGKLQAFLECTPLPPKKMSSRLPPIINDMMVIKGVSQAAMQTSKWDASSL